jgi:hypothetical protein
LMRVPPSPLHLIPNCAKRLAHTGKGSSKGDLETLFWNRKKTRGKHPVPRQHHTPL